LGGNMPQKKLNEACLALEKGEAKGVLLSGSEVIHSIVTEVVKNGAEHLGWPAGSPTIPDAAFEGIEAQYKMDLPVVVYPLIETAIRAGKGHTPEKHSKFMGELLAKFSEVCAPPLCV